MKKILVTGAGGYIGSILVNKLISKNYFVRAVDRFFFPTQQPALTSDNLQLITDDTRKLSDNLFDDIYAVIDLAAISNDPSAEQFAKATEQINYQARHHTATLAKKNNVKRYILPSSASIYGFNDDLLSETSPVNPLTVYAESNLAAEQKILPLADDNFCVTVMRQATVFGFSPRMRFDLAVNGMTYGCFKNSVLPLMRDGKQYRPMVHIQDTTDVMCLFLESDPNIINGEIFNVGSGENNFQIKELAERIIQTISLATSQTIEIDWYGDPDHRSYRLDFSKIENKLNWQASHTLEDGVAEILTHLKSGRLKKTDQTITLKWYRLLEDWHKLIHDKPIPKDLPEDQLEKWQKQIKQVEKYGGILDIE